MRTLTRLLILSATLSSVSARPSAAQLHSEITLPPNGDNQQAEVSQWIGPVKVTVAYHSPRVHLRGAADRTGHIFGDLVKFGYFDDGFGPSKATPWRAGANETTTITFSQDVQVEGTAVSAGTYGLFLLLDKSGPWQWIISRDASGWGSFQYDPKSDVLHAPVQPVAAPFTEFLTYGFDDRLPNAATLYLQWELKRIPLRIAVPDVNDRYIAAIRKDLLSWPGFNTQNWQQAAQFAVSKNVDLPEALTWADKAIYEPFRNAAPGLESFSTFQTKAAVLHALGRDPDADTEMDHALRLRDADVAPVHQYGMSLLRAGRKDRALAVFRMNRQLHPDDKFATWVGLARGEAAAGDRKKAIKAWETALANVPPAQEAGRAAFQKELEALKSP